MITFPNEHFMPSGIHAGEDLSQPMRDTLAHRQMTPPAYLPVMEDGTYDEIKECVFRVCSIRVCQVKLEDMQDELRGMKIRCQVQERKWMYQSSVARMLGATVVQVQLQIIRGDTPNLEIESLLQYLSRTYGFKYNRCSVNRKAATRIDHQYATLDPSIEVEMEITWPYWT